jgi:peptidoglycan/xylan/chitin deacetylase (PgdA/CDA1 family)
MKTYLKLSGVALMLLPMACSEADEPASPIGSAGAGTAGTSSVAGNSGSPAGGGSSSAGASSEGMDPNTPLTGGGGAATGVGAASSLPLPPSSGVARPSGSADGLAVLDWAGFQAAATYTFDDANTSQIENYPALQALGVPFTFYLWTNMAGASSPVWAQAVLDGHELGNHTQTHQMGDSPIIAADTDAGAQFIESRFGVSVRTMAAPYGHSQYIEVARTRVLINRGVGGGQIAPNDNTDPFNLPTFLPPTAAPASAFNSRVDTARTNGAWETVLVHGFSGGTDGAYQPIDLPQFVAAVDYTKSFGDVWIGTMLDVGAYWIAQKLLSTATPTTDAGTTTWQWTLPAHFPPNHYLRVTVNGGTLQQAGVALPWNDHGYYEVALDAGSLSLAP